MTGVCTSRHGPGLRPPKGYGGSGLTARYGPRAGEGSILSRRAQFENRWSAVECERTVTYPLKQSPLSGKRRIFENRNSKTVSPSSNFDFPFSSFSPCEPIGNRKSTPLVVNPVLPAPFTTVILNPVF